MLQWCWFIWPFLINCNNSSNWAKSHSQSCWWNEYHRGCKAAHWRKPTISILTNQVLIFINTIDGIMETSVMPFPVWLHVDSAFPKVSFATTIQKNVVSWLFDLPERMILKTHSLLFNTCSDNRLTLNTTYLPPQIIRYRPPDSQNQDLAPHFRGKSLDNCRPNTLALLPQTWTLITS